MSLLIPSSSRWGRLVWGYTSITVKMDTDTKKISVSFGKSQHWIWVRWRKTVVFFILLTFNMIVQPCSQRAKTTSCRLHITHYFRYRHRTYNLKGFVDIRYTFCAHILGNSVIWFIFCHACLWISMSFSMFPSCLCRFFRFTTVPLTPHGGCLKLIAISPSNLAIFCLVH